MQHSFVISIDERRLRLFRALFDANGLPQPETMRGCTDPGINPVQMRCTKSHLSCVEEAKRRNWPFVVIFEDDAYPCEGILEKLDFAQKNIPADAEIVCLNWVNLRTSNTTCMNMSEAPFVRLRDGNTVDGASCNIIFSEAFDKYISFHANLNTLTDARSYLNFRTYAANYPLFIQYSLPNFSKSMSHYSGYQLVLGKKPKSKAFPHVPPGFKPFEEYGITV